VKCKKEALPDSRACIYGSLGCGEPLSKLHPNYSLTVFCYEFFWDEAKVTIIHKKI